MIRSSLHQHHWTFPQSSAQLVSVHTVSTAVLCLKQTWPCGTAPTMCRTAVDRSGGSRAVEMQAQQVYACLSEVGLAQRLLKSCTMCMLGWTTTNVLISQVIRTCIHSLEPHPHPGRGRHNTAVFITQCCIQARQTALMQLSTLFCASLAGTHVSRREILRRCHLYSCQQPSGHVLWMQHTAPIRAIVVATSTSQTHHSQQTRAQQLCHHTTLFKTQHTPTKNTCTHVCQAVQSKAQALHSHVGRLPLLLVSAYVIYP